MHAKADDDDDDDDDDEMFLWYGWPTKGIWPYFQPEPLSEILTITNLQHAASRIWTCAEPKFRLSWMKLWSSDNHFICIITYHDNIEIMISGDADQVIKKLFDLLKNRYQKNLQSMRGSEFVFDYVQLLHCKCHKMNLNHGGSYLDPHD